MKSKAINYLIALLLILLLNFILPRLMPGDPLTAIYGEEALLSMSDVTKAELTQRYRLDQPISLQFSAYFQGLCKGELGTSYYHQAPVFDVIMSYLPWTLFLVGSSFLIAAILGTLTGFEAAWRRGKRIDRFLLTGNIILFGLPSFFIGIIFLYFFAVKGEWFPLQGAFTPYAELKGIPNLMDILEHAVLPICTMVLFFMPGHFLLARSSMLNLLKEPFVLTAKAKGLTPQRVRYVHAGRNALIPVVTAAGVQLATRIITGALFVEIVFAYPGMGLLLFQSLQNRDYPVIAGTLTLVTILVLTLNFIVDLLYGKLDPRQTHAH